MQENIKQKSQKNNRIDFSLFEAADKVEETKAAPYFLTCSICGATNNIAAFKSKYICKRCINYIKGRN